MISPSEIWSKVQASRGLMGRDIGVLLGNGEVGKVEWRDFGLMSDFVEGLDLGLREEQPASLFAAGGRCGLQLSRQHALLIAMAENVGQHGLHVFSLRAALGKHAARDRIGMDHLEKERTVLLLPRHGGAAADGRQR